MKKLALLFFFIVGFSSIQAQKVDSISAKSTNKSNNSFILKLGLNLVDSSGEKNPFEFLGSFDEMAFSENYNVELEYRFSNSLSLSAAWSSNKWKANKGKIDGSILTSDIKYSAIDLDLKYYFNEALGGWFKENNWLDLYLHGGAGSATIGDYSGITLNFGPGVNFWFSDRFGLNLNGTGKWMLNSENTIYKTNHFQYSASLMYRFIDKQPKDRDDDNDGVNNSIDDCPDVFGDPKNNGCPEKVKVLYDSDGDGVVDSKDECPDVYGTINGCPETIILDKQGVDTDGDYVLDLVDKCPNVKGLPTNNGCPLPDTDGDGIFDIADNCPYIRGFPDFNGCPLPDTDNDGVFDVADKCPTVPGIAIYNGCPLPDTDNDGVSDVADKCPTVPGFAIYNGCPHKEIIVGDKTTELNTLISKILFDSSSHNITKESLPILLKISQIMKQHPEAIFKLSGHTDSAGSKQKNYVLSRNRVIEVRDYLVNYLEVPANSIVIEYFGDTKPISSNSTKQGRRENRRVEIMRIK